MGSADALFFTASRPDSHSQRTYQAAQGDESRQGECLLSSGSRWRHAHTYCKYSQDYRYEPAFAHPVHQEFFPPELKGTRILSPPPFSERSSAPSSSAKPLHPRPNGTAKSAVRWTPGDAQPSAAAAAPEGLASTDAQGPGSCQRVWKIGERAVDLDFLEEWERERNDGVPWSGRALLGLEGGVKDEEEEEKVLAEMGAQTESAEVRMSEMGAQTEHVEIKPIVAADAGSTDAAAPLDTAPAPTSASTAAAAPASTSAPAGPPKRRGRFREPVETWDPSCLLEEESATPRPAYAVILLNAPLQSDHRRAFEHVWNNGA